MDIFSDWLGYITTFITYIAIAYVVTRHHRQRRALLNNHPKIKKKNLWQTELQAMECTGWSTLSISTR